MLAASDAPLVLDSTKFSALSQSLRQWLTPASPLSRSLWKGRLSPMQFRRFVADDLEGCLKLYKLNEPGRFPAGVWSQYFTYLAGQRACEMNRTPKPSELKILLADSVDSADTRCKSLEPQGLRF